MQIVCQKLTSIISWRASFAALAYREFTMCFNGATCIRFRCMREKINSGDTFERQIKVDESEDTSGCGDAPALCLVRDLLQPNLFAAERLQQFL